MATHAVASVLPHIDAAIHIIDAAITDMRKEEDDLHHLPTHVVLLGRIPPSRSPLLVNRKNIESTSVHASQLLI